MPNDITQRLQAIKLRLFKHLKRPNKQGTRTKLFLLNIQT